MASVAQLNVRIGGDIRALEKSLKDAERAVRTAGSRLSSWGNELSMKLSLPMLAFGAASIKAAGDIEALNKSMNATFAGAGRSVAEAKAEVDSLRKAAEAPGLDFEQAVKASIRLQGVGLQAEVARRTIVQLANAIATTGGTADNLNSVTVQFSQMISKGKIMASDLRIVQESMPVISRLMEETFGTSNSERLQEMGISGKEFVEKITAAMEKLPRVEDGISNAIVNAGTAIKMFLASVGESLNKTFNISGKLDSFANWLNGLAERFSNLSEGTQRAIAGVAVFALTLGPLLKVGSLVVQMGGAMYSAFLQIQIAFKSIQATGIIAWFNQLKGAFQITWITAITAVVLAAAAAFAILRKDMSDSAVAARTVEEVNKSAAASIVDQKSKVDLLVQAYGNEKTTLEGKKNILNQLKQISPEYFNQIKIGKGDVDALALAQGRYNAELLRTAKVTAAKDKIAELYKTMLDGEAMTDPSIWQTIGNFLGGMGSASAFAGLQVKTMASNLQENTKRTMAQIEALGKLVTAEEVATSNTKSLTEHTSKNTSASKDNASAIDKQAKAYAELDKKMRVIARQQEEALAKKYRASATDFAPIATLSPGSVTRTEKNAFDVPEIKVNADEKLLNQIKAFDAMTEAVDRLKNGLNGFGETWQQVTNYFAENGSIVQTAVVGIADSIMQAAQSGASSFGELANAALKAARSIIGAWIRQGVAAAVSKALSSLPFPFNIAAGAAAGGLAQAGFNAVLRAVKVPAFAAGGVVSGPTMAMVGEYPGARSNPEVIAPLNKLKGMLGGGQPIILQPSIEYTATGFRIMLEKENKRIGRAAGY